MFCAAISLAPLSYAAKANDNAARVEVLFNQPENFTDVKDSQMGSDRGRQGYLESFREHLQDNAARRLPEGQRLSVTFTDIDMAGEYEPWRGPNASDVRIIKDIYIPRLKFNYSIIDPQGAVVKEGRAELSEMNFQMTLSGAINNSDPLRYEKQMLDNWMRKELGAPMKKK